MDTKKLKLEKRGLEPSVASINPKISTLSKFDVDAGRPDFTEKFNEIYFEENLIFNLSMIINQRD